MSARERSLLVRYMRTAARYALTFIGSPGFKKMVGEVVFALAGRRGRRSDLDLRGVRRILVVRLDNIGDVVLTTPLLRYLREHVPGACIAMLVRPHCTELIEHCPYIDEVIGFEWQATSRLGSLQRHWQALQLAAGRLWFPGFDLVLLPRWDRDCRSEALIAYMSGARWRVGFRDDVSGFTLKRKGGSDTLLTHVVQRGPVKHEVEKHLEMLGSLGIEVHHPTLELWTSSRDEAFADELLRQRHVDPDDVLIAFGVGASHPKRLWPVEHYAALASWLTEAYNARILVIGDEGDKPRGRSLHHRLGERVIDLTSETTLRQAVSLLKRSTIFVGNDSGPAHLAAAAGVPAVVISCHPRNGSVSHGNSPQRFRPWAVPHRVLQPEKGLGSCTTACNSEEPHCITTVAVLQAKSAIQAELAALNLATAIRFPRNRLQHGS